MTNANNQPTPLDIALEQASEEAVPDHVALLLNGRFKEFRQRCADGEASHRPQRVSSVGSQRRFHRRWMVVTGAGLAACLLLVAGISALIFATPRLTLAQVQSALAKQRWMLLKYEDGEESWVSLQDERRYLKDPDGRIQHFAPGVWQQYVPPGGGFASASAGSITESRSTPEQISKLPKWTPPSPWEFLIRSMEGIERAGKLRDHPYRVEEASQTVDGQQLVRFDIIHTNSMGAEELYAQFWADPQTQLPVRSRKLRSRPGVDAEGRDEFVSGVYSFPESGPKDIYDLGVPRDAKIVTSDVTADPPAVSELLASAEKSRDGFPERIRLVMWPADRTGDSIDMIDVLHWNGKPTAKKSGQRSYHDWSGVKIRQAAYASAFDNLRLPADVDQVLAWAAGQSPSSLRVSDGERMFDQVNQEDMHVRQITNSINFPPNCWPRSMYWPYMDMGGDKTVVADPPEAIANTVLLRIEFQAIRVDYFIDPQRDHVCVKQVWWQGRQDEWRKVREFELSDFQKLPGGQWWASRQRRQSHNEPLPGKSTYVEDLNIDIAVVSEVDFPANAFDGERILNEAKARGAKIIAD